MTVPAPLALHKDVIVLEWIDYNGHMNVACYVLVFDRATDGLLDFIGLAAEYRAAANVSAFAAEMHVNYIITTARTGRQRGPALQGNGKSPFPFPSLKMPRRAFLEVP